jgi:hypothetical protein
MRFRYDRDLDALVPIGDNYFEPKPEGPQIIRDIDGYRTAAGDIANDGKRSYISSRSRHRQFLKDNGYTEVGNDYDKRQVEDGSPRRETKEQFKSRQRDRVEHIKRVAELIRTGRVREHFDV